MKSRPRDPAFATDAPTARRLALQPQKDTGPERAVRKTAWSLGLRFRRNVKELPGSPDVANQSMKWALFVNGCFWHRHYGCRRATTPDRNREAWLEKFEANKKRDRRTVRQLRQLGYVVLTVWECEVGNTARLRHLLNVRLIDKLQFRSRLDRSKQSRQRSLG